VRVGGARRDHQLLGDLAVREAAPDQGVASPKKWKVDGDALLAWDRRRGGK